MLHFIAPLLEQFYPRNIRTCSNQSWPSGHPDQMDEFYTPWMHKLNKLLEKTWFLFWSGNCNVLSCLHICDHHFFVCGLWCQKPHETKCNRHLIEASLKLAWLNPDNLVFTNFPGFLNQFQKLCLSKYSNQDVLQCTVWKRGLDV